MYAQLLTYRLTGMAEEDWQVEIEEFATDLAATPGLNAACWLADAHTPIHGVWCLWANREAVETFLHSPRFRWLTTHPCIAAVEMQEFALWEFHSRITRGLPAPLAAFSVSPPDVDEDDAEPFLSIAS